MPCLLHVSEDLDLGPYTYALLRHLSSTGVFVFNDVSAGRPIFMLLRVSEKAQEVLSNFNNLCYHTFFHLFLTRVMYDTEYKGE